MAEEAKVEIIRTVVTEYCVCVDGRMIGRFDQQKVASDVARFYAQLPIEKRKEFTKWL